MPSPVMVDGCTAWVGEMDSITALGYIFRDAAWQPTMESTGDHNQGVLVASTSNFSEFSFYLR